MPNGGHVSRGAAESFGSYLEALEHRFDADGNSLIAGLPAKIKQMHDAKKPFDQMVKELGLAPYFTDAELEYMHDMQPADVEAIRDVAIDWLADADWSQSLDITLPVDCSFDPSTGGDADVEIAKDESGKWVINIDPTAPSPPTLAETTAALENLLDDPSVSLREVYRRLGIRLTDDQVRDDPTEEDEARELMCEALSRLHR